MSDSMKTTLSSTRFRIVTIAVVIAIGKEILHHKGIEISPETFYGIETLLLTLAGLDTVRPLGMGKPDQGTETE